VSKRDLNEYSMYSMTDTYHTPWEGFEITFEYAVRTRALGEVLLNNTNRNKKTNH